MPLVSVVITTLNRVGFLAEAIESALAQTFDQIEIIVSDDGGLEATRDLCRKFQDSRIRHIVNSSPLGIAMNTYSGVMAAKSDLIAFLNDDDRWTPDFLEKCTRPLLEDDGAVLAFSDHWLIDAEGRRLDEKTDDVTHAYGRDILPPGYVKDPVALIGRNSIPLAMASVFRKSAVNWNTYSSKVEGAYDYYLSFCLLKSGGSVIYVPERLTEWRIHGENASGRLRLTNGLGSSYVTGLILNDKQFTSIAANIRSLRMRIEVQLALTYLRRLKVLPAMKHIAIALFGFVA